MLDTNNIIYSKTKLLNFLNCDVIKRMMHRTIVVPKKIIPSQILVEQKKILENKIIFNKYCEHFKNYSLAELQNDNIFITMMHNSIHNQPTLYSRAFQLALEVTYSKRKFSEQTLQEMYQNDFIIQDNFHVNKGICDQSTIYTSIIAKKIVTYLNLDIKDLIVNSTPLYLTKDKITESTKIIMDYNKKMTENTCPDFALKGRPYDLKEQKEISYSKNHIYLFDKDQMHKKGIEIFNNLEKALNNSLQNNQIILSKEMKMFTADIIKELANHRHLQTPIQSRVDSLNMFLLKKNIPKEFKMPIFVPVKKANLDDLLITNIDNDKIPLDPGHLDYVKAKKALMGILERYPADVQLKIQEATCASIQFSISKIEEVD